jgi:hypothetical protein
MRWPAGKGGIQQAGFVKVEARDVAQSAFRVSASIASAKPGMFNAALW